MLEYLHKPTLYTFYVLRHRHHYHHHHLGLYFYFQLAREIEEESSTGIHIVSRMLISFGRPWSRSLVFPHPYVHLFLS